MVSIMIGSSVFSILLSKFGMNPELVTKYLLIIALISLTVPIFSTVSTLILIQKLISFLEHSCCFSQFFNF